MQVLGKEHKTEFSTNVVWHTPPNNYVQGKENVVNVGKGAREATHNCSGVPGLLCVVVTQSDLKLSGKAKLIPPTITTLPGAVPCRAVCGSEVKFWGQCWG